MLTKIKRATILLIVSTELTARLGRLGHRAPGDVARVRANEMIPKTKKRNAVPGDTVVIFAESAIDASGTKWPKGTQMAPICGGYSNPNGCAYADMSHAGKIVRFLGR